MTTIPFPSASQRKARTKDGMRRRKSGAKRASKTEPRQDKETPGERLTRELDPSGLGTSPAVIAIAGCINQMPTHSIGGRVCLVGCLLACGIRSRPHRPFRRRQIASVANVEKGANLGRIGRLKDLVEIWSRPHQFSAA